MNTTKIKETPIVIKDSENLRNLLIQLNMEKGTVTIISNYSAWDNLAYLIEALSVTAGQCVSQEGISKEAVQEEIDRYLTEVLPARLRAF